MNSKLIVIALLAIVGLSQAANLQAKPEPKDLRVVAQKVIQIVKVIGDKIREALEKITPIAQELEDELNPELAKDVKELLLKLQAILDEIVAVIQKLEDDVTNAIGALDAEAGSCVTAADKQLDPILDAAEAKISAEWRAFLVANDGNITSITGQLRTILTTVNEATSAAISGGVACVKKGSTTVKQCLDDNTAAWTDSITSAVINLTLLVNELTAILPLQIEDLINRIKPILDQVGVDADKVWSDFGDCVAKL